MLPRRRGKIISNSFYALVLCFALAHSGKAANSAESPFEQANRLYEQGKFAEAAGLYENMIQAGRQSAPVFFNLGNAYFKDGQLGRALYNFRIAERLKPRDPDIQANLRFTRERIPDSVSQTPTLWDRAIRYFTLNELAATFAIFLWLWAALFSIGRVKLDLKPKLRTLSVAAFALTIVSLLTLLVVHSASKQQVAISTSPQAKVHLGPVAESQVAFPAPDGSELEVLAERGDWIQVRDRNDRSGWMPKSDALIFPPPKLR